MISGFAQLQDDKFRDYRTFVLFKDKGEGRLYMLGINRKEFRSNWESFSEIKKSRAYEKFRIEFVYD